MSNNSGIIPLGYKVLIKVKELEEKTRGGIIIPDEVLQKEGAASQVATLIDHGEAAFTIGMADLPKEWNILPKIGATILINKYAGINVKGKDDDEYRIITDKEIIAIFNEESK